MHNDGLSVSVLKEITEYQEKIIFGLSLRQLLFFVIAIAIGIPSYMFCRKNLGQEIAGYIVILEVLPLLALGFVRKNGFTFDKYLGLIVKHNFQTKKRSYKTELLIDKKLPAEVLGEATYQRTEDGKFKLTPGSKKPSSGKKEKLSKEEKNRLRRIKREAAPQSAQRTIQYKRLLEDGICEVEPGLYSITIKFSDINYQTARHEDQEGIFNKYSQFLNYFDPAINVQISVRNRPIDKDEFRKQMFIPLGHTDGLDEYRREYNQMLGEKALEGKNSVVRERLITLGVKADNYEDAISSLMRLETDIISNFKALNCEAQLLSGAERVEVLHSMLRPQEAFMFKYNYLLNSSLTTKDFVAPTSFNFSEKATYEFGNWYGQTLFLRDLPPELSDELLKRLTEIHCNMTITIHFNAVAQDKALGLVKQKISFMEQQKIDEQKKAQRGGYDEDMLSPELRYSLIEAKELLDHLQNKNQRMFKVTVLINTIAEDPGQLKDNVEKIMSTARSINCLFAPLDYLQEAAVNSSLPLGKNFVDIRRTLTTASTAILMPFTTQELFQPGGIYYGLNAISRNLIFFDRKTLKTPSGFLLGTPGSGKSFSAKREIVSVLLNTDDEVLVIDPEREYTPLAAGLGGEVIHISAGSKHHINPLDISMDYGDSEDPWLFKNDFVLSLCEIMIGGKKEMDGHQRSVIDRASRLTYQEYFKSNGTAPMPTLKDFYHHIKDQPEKEAEGIALSLEMYIEGGLSVFANPTNVDIQKRFVVYDIRDLGKQLKTMGMLIVLDQIWNRITQNRAIGRRTWIFIDEIYLLFQNEYSANYLFELYKRARKWGAIPTGITQNVEDLLISDMARRMLSNSEFVVMLNQASSDREELAHLLNISSRQLSHVTNVGAGEGLILAGNSIIPFKDKFPTNNKLYQMMTTKIEEVTL
jgi:type IV secretory pathway VirB4 component